MHYYMSSTIFLLFGHMSYGSKCIRNGVTVCCSGYKLNNRSGQCDKCPPGYTGMECIYRCIYPTYGKDCFMECTCSAEMCDFESGCNYISTSADHDTSYTNISASNKTESLARTTIMISHSPPISMSSISIVFYTTVVLIAIFMISFLIYGSYYLRKICISKQEFKTSVLQTKSSDNPQYECVDFRRHM